MGISFSGVGGPLNAPRKIFCNRWSSLMVNQMPEHEYNIMKEFESLIRSVLPRPPFLGDDITDDTALVLLATSLVDDFLKLSLVAIFRKSAVSKRRIDDVFGSNGALGTFSAKISLTLLIGLTDADTAHDLAILRKIRNEFAHSFRRLSLRSFSSCLSLRKTSKIAIIDDCEERRRFKQSCAGIVGHLCASVSIQIAVQRFASKNTDGIARELEVMNKESFPDGEAPL